MQKVIALSQNKDIQSTAYTYLGLSEAGQGDYSASRTFFMKAVQFDPNYRNNTAREELSGLH
jgi:lipoprotein NlpI